MQLDCHAKRPRLNGREDNLPSEQVDKWPQRIGMGAVVNGKFG
jgi:hypothetical protein